MTDSEAIDQIRAALVEIRETPSRWGEVIIIVSGGDVKYVNVTKPTRASYCVDDEE